MSAEEKHEHIDKMSGGRELGGTHFGQVPGDADVGNEGPDRKEKSKDRSSERSGSPLSDTGPAQPNDVDQPEKARGPDRSAG